MATTRCRSGRCRQKNITLELMIESDAVGYCTLILFSDARIARIERTAAAHGDSLLAFSFV